MAKLWDRGTDLNTEIERFTVGEDTLLDRALIEADVLGSIAHAEMLSGIGVLTKEEFRSLREALLEILQESQSGDFEIKREDEDVHTAVENALTRKLGDLGKKIHAARSRNDQVLVDTRIYTRARLLSVETELLKLAETLTDFADRHKEVPMPGRTHTQRAMPSSVGLWAGAFSESLLDDLELLKTVYHLNNQCPLGSAASYGVPLPIDRQRTSDLLGFDRVQNNVLYANNSRGKIEAMVLFALSQVTEDLSKLSNDLILFSVPEFGYFTLPEEHSSGSSIMPQKRNPDPLELVRAKSAGVVSRLLRMIMIVRNLPSGYNRDFQDTKKPLMEALGTTESCLKVVRLIFTRLRVNQDVLVKSFTPELFAADEALRLVAEGTPFRDAYRDVAKRLDELKTGDPAASIRKRTHLGATGNLGLDHVRTRIESEIRRIEGEGDRLTKVRERLMKRERERGSGARGQGNRKA
ncbi:MAG: argininosuccinate lyase [Candidatus Latescibacteria bacterium 4484_107]|nr:MAG: argininosuccinate lyase [Candidatus Latescibacteria bacterium 4484_107]